MIARLVSVIYPGPPVGELEKVPVEVRLGVRDRHSRRRVVAVDQEVSVEADPVDVIRDVGGILVAVLDSFGPLDQMRRLDRTFVARAMPPERHPGFLENSPHSDQVRAF